MESGKKERFTDNIICGGVSYIHSIAMILSIIFFIYGIYRFSYILLLGIFILTVVFAFNATRIYGNKHPERKRPAMRIFLWSTLAFYLFFLFMLTFSVGRSTPQLILGNDELIREYYENRCNFIPFRTIRTFFGHGASFRSVMVNIVGNILALTPLGILFPALFPKARKAMPFLLMTSAVVIFIESVQFMFGVGACDIDDLILNAAGAFAVFLVFRRSDILTKMEEMIWKKY